MSKPSTYSRFSLINSDGFSSLFDLPPQLRGWNHEVGEDIVTVIRTRDQSESSGDDGWISCVCSGIHPAR